MGIRIDANKGDYGRVSLQCFKLSFSLASCHVEMPSWKEARGQPVGAAVLTSDLTSNIPARPRHMPCE